MNDDVKLFIQGCLAGETTNWDEIRSIALKFLRHRYRSASDDHADIVQNVIIKLLQGFQRFNGTTANELRQYINVATVREAVSYYRKNARHQSHDSLDQTLNSNTDGTLYDLLPDNRLDSASVAAVRDLFKRASEQLSIRDKQILIYKADGYKDREIAEILGMTTGGVGVTYSRIKDALRRTLAVALIIILFGRKLPWVTSL